MSTHRYTMIQTREEAIAILDLPKTADTWDLRVKAGRFLDMQHRRAKELESERLQREAEEKSDRRLERMRELAASRPHRCAAYGCDEMIPGQELMCLPHLELLPRWLRNELHDKRDAKAEMQWPLELVEQAIRITMTEHDRSEILTRIETSSQEALFEEVA